MKNANFTSYQKGVHLAGRKLYSAQMSNFRNLNFETKVFKPAMKDYFVDFFSNRNLVGTEHIMK